MRIVVLVKQVPDPNTVVYQIDPGTKRLVREGVANVLDPGAEVALEAALQLAEKDGNSTVTVLSMGPEDAVDAIRRALAMGANDGALVTDDALEGSDALSTAKALAAALKEIEYDIIFSATESTDGYSGMVPGMVAELLGIPHLSFIRTLDIQNGTLTGQRVTANDGELGEQHLRRRLGEAEVRAFLDVQRPYLELGFELSRRHPQSVALRRLPADG